MGSLKEKGPRSAWASRTTFILASIGSAVGLGNAWRFPGLVAKHGGSAFIIAYVIIMLVFGIPLLMMEVGIGRHMRKGAPEAMRGINRKCEPIGWMSTTAAFVIVIYYAVVFAWVIMMAVISFKFAGITGDSAQAATVWETTIQTTGSMEGLGNISTIVLICLLAAWLLMWFCIRDGAQSVGKVVKYTVALPVVCLLVMAIKGLTMPGAMDGMKALFIPDFKMWTDATLWIDAAGQVFYSLSVMMAIMFAYGSFLKDDANIAEDVMIIAGADFLTSMLSSIVLYSTLYGVGMTTADMSASGIGTAFYIYPTAIVNLTNNGALNAVFAFVFYFCLCTLAIDSAFSIVEGVSTAVADKFNLKRKNTTIAICIVAGVISVLMTTGAGLAILDIVDNWSNSFNLIIVGIFESIAVGWCFKTSKVLAEINKNTKKFKMPSWWFNIAVRFIAPLVLIGLLGWNVYDLIMIKNGVYGGYPIWANIVFGWFTTALVLVSGFVVKIIVKAKKKKGFVENDVTWDEMDNRELAPVKSGED